jgi:hypothetical protein
MYDVISFTCIRRLKSNLCTALTNREQHRKQLHCLTHKQTVALQLAAGRNVQGSKSDWGEILRAHLYQLWIPHTLLYNGVKRPQGGVNHPPIYSSEVKESRAIFLLPFWSFVACSGVNFTFCWFLEKQIQRCIHSSGIYSFITNERTSGSASAVSMQALQA